MEKDGAAASVTGGGKLCFICCFSISSSTSDGDGSLSPPHLEELSSFHDFRVFCEQLEEIREEGGAGNHLYRRNDDGDRETFIANSLLALMNSSPCNEKLTVCPGCLDLIIDSISMKMVMENTEESVRGLQNRLQELLKVLKDHTERFHRTMKRIEETVENSDAAYLQNYIAKEGGKSKSWMKRDIKLFRDRILEVSEVARLHNQNLVRVTEGVPLTPSGAPTLKRKPTGTARDSQQAPLLQPPPPPHTASVILAEGKETETILLPVKTEEPDADFTNHSDGFAADDYFDNDYNPGDDDQQDTKVEISLRLTDTELTRKSSRKPNKTDSMDFFEREANYDDEPADTSTSSSGDDNYSPSPSTSRKRLRNIKNQLKRKPPSNRRSSSTRVVVPGRAFILKSKSSLSRSQQLPLEFVLTSRGKKGVILNNFLYTMDYKFDRKQTYLRCSSVSSGCKARITLIDYRYANDSYSHYFITSNRHVDHPPHHEKIEKWRKHDLESLEQKRKRKAAALKTRVKRDRARPVKVDCSDQPLKFVKTNRGNKCIVLNNYIYYRNSENRGTVYFTCAGKSHHGCKQVIIIKDFCEVDQQQQEEDNDVDNDKLPYTSYKISGVHTDHPSHEEQIFKLKLHNRAKDIMESANVTQTTSILNQVEHEMMNKVGTSTDADAADTVQIKSAVEGLSKSKSMRRWLCKVKQRRRDQRLMCHECGESFMNQQILDEHEKTHEGYFEGGFDDYNQAEESAELEKQVKVNQANFTLL